MLAEIGSSIDETLAHAKEKAEPNEEDIEKQNKKKKRMEKLKQKNINLKKVTIPEENK